MTPAAAGTDARCPRCGAALRCGAAGPAPCACAAVPLDAALSAQLRQAFDGCLCLGCLRALADGAPLKLAPPGA